MDLVYVPEILTYGYFRAAQYRDYEQPWNKDYFNYGKSSQSHSQRVPQHHEQKLLSKDNCHLCRENKRRSLAAYIRGKSRRNSCHEIHEVVEEEEEEGENCETGNIKENANTDYEASKAENEYSKKNDQMNERK